VIDWRGSAELSRWPERILTLPIPAFTISGVLPPFLGTTPADPAAMSPYRATLIEVAGTMCGTDARKEIFRGLLAYRQALDGIGITTGFQWLSGSFLEDIETLESRPPADVDLVTFCHRPPGAQAQADWNALLAANAALFEPPQIKAAFRCDAYFVDMDIPPWAVVSQSRYWFGLFAHRRGGLWKGLLEIPLAVSNDDTDAAVMVQP
jgi:hypothetical protein